jgi:hypothetical protein
MQQGSYPNGISYSAVGEEGEILSGHGGGEDSESGGFELHVCGFGKVGVKLRVGAEL